MDDQFKNAEKEFKQLRDEFNRKSLSEPDFKKKLKELRLQDEQGHFWTIGAQTGKWYCFDGDLRSRKKEPFVSIVVSRMTWRTRLVFIAGKT
jgi:hypothetical protein